MHFKCQAPMGSANFIYSWQYWVAERKCSPTWVEGNPLGRRTVCSPGLSAQQGPLMAVHLQHTLWALAQSVHSSHGSVVAVSSGSWGQRYSHRQRAAFLPVAAQALWLQPKWEKQLPVHISFPKFLGLLQLKIPFTKSRTMKGIFYISFNPSDTPQGRHSHYHFRKVN